MSKKIVNENNEIDISELFVVLWSGKWLIVIFVLIGLLIGYTYSQSLVTKYNISIPYDFNIYSVVNRQNCAGNIGCLDSNAVKSIAYLRDQGWVIHPSVLSLSTTKPKSIDEYESIFRSVNEKITNSMLSEAKNEISVIKNDSNRYLQQTERSAVNFLNANRIVELIDNGNVAVRFGTPSISKEPLKTIQYTVSVAIVSALSAMLFLLIRCFFVTGLIKAKA